MNGQLSFMNLKIMIAVYDRRFLPSKKAVHQFLTLMHCTGRTDICFKLPIETFTSIRAEKKFITLKLPTKMKKVFKISILFALMISTIICGCSKNAINEKLKEPSNLNDDVTFIELTTDTYDFINFLSQNVKQNSLKFTSLQQQLSQLQNENLSFDEQMTAIDKIFKGTISVRLATHMKIYSTNWNLIKAAYSTIPVEILNKECAEVLRNKAKKINKNVAFREYDEFIESEGGCGWRYYLCSGAATAGAILCHAGCDTTALATTAGVGIPVCVALCGMLQVWAISQCYDNYCS
jgi:hypothetical protein